MRQTALASLMACCLLSACAHLDEAAPIVLPEAPAYKGVRPAAAGVPVQADDWWTAFGDPELDRLEQRLRADSPDLASAYARYRQAVAATAGLRAARVPAVGVSADAQRNRQSERRPLRGATSPDYYNSGTLALSLDYEVDLWGRIGRQIDAGIAQEAAAEADLAGARLALQARLADTLLALRGVDAEIALLGETEAAYARALVMIGERYRLGTASGLDLARAEAQLESARSQSHQVRAQRALHEHAIAALVGAHASVFDIEPAPVEKVVPVVPVGLPSDLLQRRPDIAAEQRRVVAANASVGVARRAYFPSLRLSASGGYQSSDLDNLVAAPNVFWALGSGLVAAVFDGGRRQAEVARAEAVLDEAGQRYRGTVLAAFQQVEDQLVLLDEYGQAAVAERLTVAAAQRALDIATNRYRDGVASYLEVVTAQTSSLQARRNALDLTTRQQRATVELVRAIGGGWSTSVREGM